eukprot:UN03885
MNLKDFTYEEPAHHHPNDKKPLIEVEDEWLLAEPSGFVSQRPTNPEWHVHDRLVFNTLPQEAPFPDPAVVKANYDAAMSANDAQYVAMVTGSNGILGRRLVSMLVERGATRVIAVDVLPPADDVKAEHVKILGEDVVVAKIDYQTGTIENAAFVTPLLSSGVDVIFNAASLVDPYKHPTIAYERVNAHAVSTLIKLARDAGVKKFIQVTTPFTRMNFETEAGGNYLDATEEQLPAPLSFPYRVEYAKSKAKGDVVVLENNDQDFFTACVAPTQLYSEYEDKFLTPLLKSAISDELRIVGDGKNKISICYVDNACHALILVANKMTCVDSKPCGQYYLVHDDQHHYYYGLIDDMVVRGGLQSLKHRFKAPSVVAKAFGLFNKLVDPSSKINPWTVKLMTINRTFNIAAIKNDVGYAPIVGFEDAWLKTCEALLTLHNLPFYKNVKWYYEGVDYDPELELKKAEEEERRIAAEKAAKEAEELKAAQEAEAKAEKERVDAEDTAVANEAANQVVADVIANVVGPKIEQEEEKQTVAVVEETKVEEPVAVVEETKVEEQEPVAVVEEEAKIEEPVEQQQEEVKVEEPVEQQQEEVKVEEPVAVEEAKVEEPVEQQQEEEVSEEAPQEETKVEEQTTQQEVPKKKGKKGRK